MEHSIHNDSGDYALVVNVRNRNAAGRKCSKTTTTETLRVTTRGCARNVGSISRVIETMF